MKDKIREFVLGLGVDDVGFAAVSDYHSPKSPRVDEIFPGAKSMVVMAYRELSTCDSPNMQIAMNGRLDLMEFSRSRNYKLARFLERECGSRAMTAPISYPMNLSLETMGSVRDVEFWRLYQAGVIGFQYFCFNCLKSCPVGRR